MLIRLRRAPRRLVKPFNFRKRDIEKRIKHVRRMSFKDLSYRISLGLLTLIFLGLIVCTEVDMILQSFQTGQYWNGLIIILAFAFYILVAFVIYIVRVLDTRRSLARIPRPYMIGPYDMPKRMAEYIASDKQRCLDIYHSQVDPKSVQHSGLANPESEYALDEPFAETVDTMPTYIERRIMQIDPALHRPVGQGLREYLELVLAYRVIAPEHTSTVREFVGLYDYARFSGVLLDNEPFKALMLSFGKLLMALSKDNRDFETPEVETLPRDNYSDSSIIIHAQ